MQPVQRTVRTVRTSGDSAHLSDWLSSWDATVLALSPQHFPGLRQHKEPAGPSVCLWLRHWWHSDWDLRRPASSDSAPAATAGWNEDGRHWGARSWGERTDQWWKTESQQVSLSVSLRVLLSELMMTRSSACQPWKLHEDQTVRFIRYMHLWQFLWQHWRSDIELSDKKLLGKFSLKTRKFPVLIKRIGNVKIIYKKSFILTSYTIFDHYIIKVEIHLSYERILHFQPKAEFRRCLF